MEAQRKRVKRVIFNWLPTPTGIPAFLVAEPGQPFHHYHDNGIASKCIYVEEVIEYKRIIIEIAIERPDGTIEIIKNHNPNTIFY